METVTEAAERFAISQPAVSMQLRTIAGYVGATLFRRQGRRLVPTEAGLRVYRHALHAIREEEELFAAIRDLDHGTAGRMTISASQTIGTYYLPLRLTRFTGMAKHAQVSLTLGSNAETFDRVIRGEVDLGVTAGSDVPARLSSVEFHRERLRIVVSPTHSVATTRSLTLDTIFRCPLIAFSQGSRVNDLILSRLQEAGLRKIPHVAMYLGHPEAIKRAVEAGAGVGVLLECAVREELDVRSLHDITPARADLAYPPFAIVFRAGKQLSPLQLRLIRFLTEDESGAAS